MIIIPKEETIELRKIRNIIGDLSDLPSQSPRASLTRRLKAIQLRQYGMPQLQHDYGSYEPHRTLTLDTGEDIVYTLYSNGTYLYAGLSTIPGKIVKIDLATFTKIGTVTLDTGEDAINTSYSDGTYLYAGLFTMPGEIVKIDLATFTKIGTVTLDTGENFVRTLYSDGTYLYAGLDTTPGKIVKIDLATFTKIGTVTLDTDEDAIYTFYSDGTYLYAGLFTVSGKIVKIDLATFTKIGTVTLDTGEDYVTSLYSDGTYLYAGLDTTPGEIIKIDLITFKKINYLMLYDSSIQTIIIDGTYLYAGLFTVPGAIDIIDLATFTKIGTITLDTGEDAIYTFYSDGTYLYAGLFTTPGKIVRRYIIPTTTLHDKKIDLIDEQLHTGIYSVYPTLATGTIVTSNAVAWTKGSYAQVIPASTILNQFFITGIILYNLTANTEYEIDIATGAAASESIISTVTDMTDNTNLAHTIQLPVPIKVSSNTRISARCADSTGGQNCKIKIQYKN